MPRCLHSSPAFSGNHSPAPRWSSETKQKQAEVKVEVASEAGKEEEGQAEVA